jgi:hypothetical protein
MPDSDSTPHCIDIHFVKRINPPPPPTSQHQLDRRFHWDPDPRPRTCNTSCTAVQTRNDSMRSTVESDRKLMALHIELMSPLLKQRRYEYYCRVRSQSYGTEHKTDFSPSAQNLRKRYQKDVTLVGNKQLQITYHSVVTSIKEKL